MKKIKNKLFKTDCVVIVPSTGSCDR